MTKFKSKLFKSHFVLILLVLFNFFMRLVTGFSLSSQLILVLKLYIYTSGIVLFFMTLRPFEKRSLYFLIYPLAPLLVFISWLADGILGAVLGSLFFWGLTVDQAMVNSDQYTVSKKFSGFLGSCCEYQLKKNYFCLFEEDIAVFRLEETELTNASFKVNPGAEQIQLKYLTSQFNGATQEVDTTFVFAQGGSNN